MTPNRSDSRLHRYIVHVEEGFALHVLYILIQDETTRPTSRHQDSTIEIRSIQHLIYLIINKWTIAEADLTPLSNVYVSVIYISPTKFLFNA